MSGSFTAEDFAQANLATRGESGVARRAEPRLTHQWRAYGEGHGWFSDEEMAEQGWVPVVESRVTEHTLRDSQEKAARKRQRLLDHIADQDRVIRRRNDEIAALRRELADAQAPLSLDALAAAWEAAEVADECRKGDVLIRNDEYGGFHVYTAAADGQIPTSRILFRAPKREPWADLADDLADRSALMDEDAIEAAAKALHLAGWRKGGDDE